MYIASGRVASVVTLLTLTALLLGFYIVLLTIKQETESRMPLPRVFQRSGWPLPTHPVSQPGVVHDLGLSEQSLFLRSRSAANSNELVKDQQTRRDTEPSADEPSSPEAQIEKRPRRTRPPLPKHRRPAVTKRPEFLQ